MLARLAQVPCAETVEADRSGRFLRLRIAASDADACAEEVTRRLAEAGVEVDRADAGELVSVGRWYGPETVGELSAEEADRLADEFSGTFARERSLSAETRRRVRAAVAEQFRGAFAAHRHDPSGDASATIASAAGGIRAALQGVLEPRLVEQLVARIDARLRELGSQPRA